MNIFVGNLSFETTEDDLKKLFGEHGLVVAAKIVTRKEKAGHKSRGFGFVNMPDDAQAMSAINALAGKEFMGRPIDVTAARPKSELEGQVKPKPQAQPRIEAPAVEPFPEGAARPRTWGGPRLGKPGTYGGGRRSRSYIARKTLAGEKAEIKPRRRDHDNPMRWRKKTYSPKPWQKKPAEDKPRQKEAGTSAPKPKPWYQDAVRKSWQKKTGASKPWLKKKRP